MSPATTRLPTRSTPISALLTWTPLTSTSKLVSSCFRTVSRRTVWPAAIAPRFPRTCTLRPTSLVSTDRPVLIGVAQAPLRSNRRLRHLRSTITIGLQRFSVILRLRLSSMSTHMARKRQHDRRVHPQSANLVPPALAEGTRQSLISRCHRSKRLNHRSSKEGRRSTHPEGVSLHRPRHIARPQTGHRALAVCLAHSNSSRRLLPHRRLALYHRTPSRNSLSRRYQTESLTQTTAHILRAYRRPQPVSTVHLSRPVAHILA